MNLDTLQKAAQSISDARDLLICSGAGMGVDSGLPDFRGKNGFWNAYPMYEKLDLNFFDLASPVWFKQDIELAWGFYGHRYNMYKSVTPHRGFKILRRIALEKNSFFIVTSNVDNHFQKSGFPQDSILEIHGSINHFQCTENCSNEVWLSSKDLKIDIDERDMRAKGSLPECRYCSLKARPNILMFNDWSWSDKRTSMQEFFFNEWQKNLTGGKLAIIEIGAGITVPSVRNISEHMSDRFAADLIRINPDYPETGDRGCDIRMKGLDALIKIEEVLYSGSE